MKRSFKKIFAILACVTVLAAMCIPAAFAADDAASEAVSAITSGFGQITSTITIGNILSVLGIVLAVAVGFFFFWWGIRTVVRVVTAAFKKGKISV